MNPIEKIIEEIARALSIGTGKTWEDCIEDAKRITIIRMSVEPFIAYNDLTLHQQEAIALCSLNDQGVVVFLNMLLQMFGKAVKENTGRETWEAIRKDTGKALCDQLFAFAHPDPDAN